MPEVVFLGNRVELWLFALATATALAFFLWLVRKTLTRWLKDIGEEGYRGYAQALLRAVVGKTNLFFIIALSVLAGLQWIDVAAGVEK